MKFKAWSNFIISPHGCRHDIRNIGLYSVLQGESLLRSDSDPDRNP